MTDKETKQTDQGAPLTHLLQKKSGGIFSRRRLLIAGAVFVAVAGSFAVFRSNEKPVGPRFHTEDVEVGTLVAKVSASGNLQPTNQVDVGSELSGIVDRVLVDDNDRVKKGQELARLDLAKLQDAVAKSKATLAASEAQVLQAQATAAEARAALSRYRQVAELSGGKVPSKSEMDTAEANLKRAEANEAVARAGVTQARANLQSDVTNLSKASIRSPINGLVLTRKVEPGQTVAASFQAPVLFTLAEDLSKMELQVNVDEADVGQVKVGQKATFSVDAWPGRKYDAVVTRVGYGSQKIEGVVSYITVLQVANDDLTLRPGMTGIAEITTLTRQNALLVPNAALRFTPPAATGGGRKKQKFSVMGALMPRPPRMGPKPAAPPKEGATKVWVLRDGKPAPVEVKTGATNGRVTEIVAGDLKSGMKVITEAVEKAP